MCCQPYVTFPVVPTQCDETRYGLKAFTGAPGPSRYFFVPWLGFQACQVGTIMLISVCKWSDWPADVNRATHFRKLKPANSKSDADNELASLPTVQNHQLSFCKCLVSEAVQYCAVENHYSLYLRRMMGGFERK